MHSVHGNGAKGKGKGKPKGKNAEQNPNAASQYGQMTSSQADYNDREFRNAITAAMPEEARLRAQSQLLDEEWSVPVVPPQCLGKRNAIALVTKDELREVLERVQFTTGSVAALLTEHPTALGLIGYEATRVRCTLLALGPENERVKVTVNRWLVQLGFGPPAAYVR